MVMGWCRWVIVYFEYGMAVMLVYVMTEDKQEINRRLVLKVHQHDCYDLTSKI